MDFVYAVYDMNADSWVGSITLKSLHATEDSAVAAIPDSLKKDSYIRAPHGDFVRDFTYEAVRKMPVRP